jgi:hypothetical protein
MDEHAWMTSCRLKAPALCLECSVVEADGKVVRLVKAHGYVVLVGSEKGLGPLLRQGVCRTCRSDGRGVTWY